jgi:phosphoadenosine phosphosulfate reductase
LKPIFKEEREFLEEQLGIKLPDYCWRNGMSIYLNSNTKPAIIRFTIKDNKLKIKTNNIDKVLKNNKNKTYEEEIQENKDRLIKLENETIKHTINFIKQYPEYEIRDAHSGGKDSDVLYHILNNKIFPLLDVDDYKIDFNNTTNDTAQTYLHVKFDLDGDKLEIHNPKKGIHKWIAEDKNYFLPSVTVRNCCSTYKEGRMKDYLDKDGKYILLLGMRKDESSKRSKYDWDLNKVMGEKSNVPDNWKRFLPLVNWTDADIWLYILMNNIKINEMYYKGYNRCGCLICPYASDYVDLLTQKYYPHQWERWMKLVEKNYEVMDVGNRLKWTLQEWLDGKWKQGMSKEQYLIQNKATKQKIKELAEIKGISEELAEKYFQRKCSCGKKLNPDEIAMNLKMYGRNID